MHISIQQSYSVFVDVLLSQVREEGVTEGLLHRNTTSRVQIKHLCHQIQSILVEIFEIGLRVNSLEFRE